MTEKQMVKKTKTFKRAAYTLEIYAPDIFNGLIPRVMEREGYQHLAMLDIIDVFNEELDAYMDETRKDPDYYFILSVLEKVDQQAKSRNPDNPYSKPEMR